MYNYINVNRASLLQIYRDFFRTFVVPLEVSLLLTGSPDLHSEVVTLSYMRYLID